MKNITSILLIAVLVTFGLTAAPLPSPKGGRIVLVCSATDQPDVVAGTAFFRSMPDEGAWRPAGVVPGTGIASLVVPDARFGETFYAAFVDAAGTEFDPSAMVTNRLTVCGPVGLMISR